MLGREVDVEESAIAEEFQKLARSEREQTLPALAQARALDFPGCTAARGVGAKASTLLSSRQSDDCVRMLAGEGTSLRKQRDTAHQIRAFLTDANVNIVRNARSALRNQVALCWPNLPDKLLPEAATISELLVLRRSAKSHTGSCDRNREDRRGISGSLFRATSAAVRCIRPCHSSRPGSGGFRSIDLYRRERRFSLPFSGAR